MQDISPNKVEKYERGIVNFESMNGPGTHYTAYKKSIEICLTLAVLAIYFHSL